MFIMSYFMVLKYFCTVYWGIGQLRYTANWGIRPLGATGLYYWPRIFLACCMLKSWNWRCNWHMFRLCLLVEVTVLLKYKFCFVYIGSSKNTVYILPLAFVKYTLHNFINKAIRHSEQVIYNVSVITIERLLTEREICTGKY